MSAPPALLEPFRGATVEVRDGDVEGALKTLKTIYQRTVRPHAPMCQLHGGFYLKPGERRRLKHRKALTRARKRKFHVGVRIDRDATMGKPGWAR